MYNLELATGTHTVYFPFKTSARDLSTTDNSANMTCVYIDEGGVEATASVTAVAVTNLSSMYIYKVSINFDAAGDWAVVVRYYDSTTEQADVILINVVVT